MTHSMDTPERPTADSTASEWLVRMESGAITGDERRRFAEWLAADPAHPAAYRKTERFWRALDGLPPDDIRALNRYLPQQAPSETTRRIRPWHRFTTVAASLLLVTALGLWLTGPVGDYHTAVGEQRTITLADGSTVQLNTNTALSVSILEGERRLTLHHGEAFFTVAPDSMRPFEVTAGNGTIRALGTAFNIRTDRERTTVTVTEHRVRVRLGQASSVDVDAGQRLDYRPGGWMGRAERADVTRTLAWQHHRMVFENQPLPEVLDELARYRSGQIVILRDESLNTLSITGSFDTDRLDRLFPALEESLPVHVVTFADRLILLYPSRNKKS
ncbi:MAG: FecR family protein [Nitrospira sp.]|nr:FecR family protein [Nitrospira sp.]